MSSKHKQQKANHLQASLIFKRAITTRILVTIPGITERLLLSLLEGSDTFYEPDAMPNYLERSEPMYMILSEGSKGKKTTAQNPKQWT